MLGYMTILSAIVAALATIVIVDVIRKKELSEVSGYFLVGLVIAAIDFVTEYAGTSWGGWHYNSSIWMIKGLVPIELVLIFFSCGVLLRYGFVNISKMRTPIKINTMLYITTVFALVIYIRELYLGIRTYELVVAVPRGLWGILNIREKNREAAFAIALLAIISDLVIETLIIGAGGYHYANGFTLLIPMTYGMLVLGMLGLIEQSHRLDAMLDAPQIQKLLRIFGVQRFVNRELRKK